MDKRVQNYVRSCEVCQRTKHRTQLPNGLLAPHDVPPYPFHTISIDRITDLPVGTSNLCEIDVFMCKLTKYTFLVPQRANATALYFAKSYFDTVFRHHGFPARIISDRDPLFTSEFWKHLSVLAGKN